MLRRNVGDDVLSHRSFDCMLFVLFSPPRSSTTSSCCPDISFVFLGQAWDTQLFSTLCGAPIPGIQSISLKKAECVSNRARRQSGFPTFISCQRQDVNVLPKRRQSHQGDKLCDVSTVPLVARWPVFLARGSDADGEPHYQATPTVKYPRHHVRRLPTQSSMAIHGRAFHRVGGTYTQAKLWSP